MNDLISREAARAIKVLPKCFREYETNNLDDAYEKGWKDAMFSLNALPTIDPVKHGRLADGIVSFHWTCSECGCHLRKDLGQVFERETDRYNYCPNCGASMERRGR